MNYVLFKHLRQVAGFTQTELALKVGCERSIISKVENGTKPITKRMESRLHLALKEAGISGKEVLLLQQVIFNKKGMDNSVT
ncbi:helix-turn-helix domain-containing protein [Halobacillus litoralis]|uniref:helix-turn-helix domain-containing protein n=1 Tax=Halobacillus litoralis TaxID=45668 RepID=UPI001CD4ADC4|nr:helix-turn-helix transcriptional regulator [Halobacillus litoralis]MCA1024280.1 helix-turn-helix domain-containing protein [Halobacillus litoralis]